MHLLQGLLLQARVLLLCLALLQVRASHPAPLE